MNDIEQAIRRLESRSIIPFDDDADEVCGLAIQALQEKLEQNKEIRETLSKEYEIEII